ncbi:MAG: exodeoxyribonuclease VII small subunit [Deltaproteobacteria bacterium]|nr:exodeoxyribonuclease VII small subunit [Deltaproteobacteria bacterium]
MKKAAAAENQTFEKALGRLEAIVNRMEGGGLPLEEALNIFEEGIRLSRLCASKLDEAETKVELLVKQGENQFKSVPFEPAEEDSPEPE